MAVCPICCNAIVDATETSEGEEALFCEGTCNKWLHRCCAGVHKDDYAVLATSSKPFFCPSCCLSEHRQLITTLIATVESLKDEIRELKKESEAADKPSTLTSVCSDACKEVHTSDLSRESVAQESASVPAKEQGWQKVKAKRRRGRKKNKREDEADVKTATPLNQQASKPSKQSQSKPQWLHVKNLTPSQQPDQHRGQSTRFESRISPETVQVDGVRRVWGTLRGCSSKTVLMVLQRLSTVAEKVEVRRKYKKNKNNTVQWYSRNGRGFNYKHPGNWNAVIDQSRVTVSQPQLVETLFYPKSNWRTFHAGCLP